MVETRQVVVESGEAEVENVFPVGRTVDGR